MAAMLRRNKTNRRVVSDFRSGKRSIRNEGIVLRGDHQKRHTNLRGDALGAGMLVVILRVAVAKLRRGNNVIKFAHGSDRTEAVELVALWKHFLLARVASHQAGDKVPLIKIVFSALEGVGASGEVERGTHHADATERCWHARGKFSRHFSDEISSHRVA